MSGLPSLRLSHMGMFVRDVETESFGKRRRGFLCSTGFARVDRIDARDDVDVLEKVRQHFGARATAGIERRVAALRHCRIRIGVADEDHGGGGLELEEPRQPERDGRVAQDWDQPCA